MAFGNHDFETAVKIAAEKEKELGRGCKVFPSEDEPGKFTIGIEIKAMSGLDLINRASSMVEGKAQKGG